MNPLSLHERHQLAAAVVALRSDDVGVAQHAVDDLFAWPLRRLFAVLHLGCRRYLSLLQDLERVSVASPNEMSALLDAVAGQLPGSVRPAQSRLFEGLALVLAGDSDAMVTTLHADPARATMTLLYLFTGLSGVGGQDVPATASLVAAASFPSS